jgi:hypothetical protein
LRKGRGWDNGSGRESFNTSNGLRAGVIDLASKIGDQAGDRGLRKGRGWDNGSGRESFNTSNGLRAGVIDLAGQAGRKRGGSGSGYGGVSGGLSGGDGFVGVGSVIDLVEIEKKTSGGRVRGGKEAAAVGGADDRGEGGELSAERLETGVGAEGAGIGEGEKRAAPDWWRRSRRER